MKYSCIRQEWSVGVRVRSFGIVGRIGGLLDVARREVVVWLKTCRLNSSYSSQFFTRFYIICAEFLVYEAGTKVQKLGKSNRRISNIHMFYTQSELYKTLDN